MAHKVGSGHRLAGELMAAAAFEAIWGRGWRDFRVESARARQRRLTVCWSVPQPPLVLRTEPERVVMGQGVAMYGCSAHPRRQFGLEVHDAMGEIELTEIKVSNSRCIETRLARTVSQGAVFRVSWRATSAPTRGFGCQGSLQNAFTNVADSTRGPIHFFALPSETPVLVEP